MQEQLTAGENCNQVVSSDQIQSLEKNYAKYIKLCTKEMDEKIETLQLQNQNLTDTIYDLQAELEKSACPVDSISRSI